MKLLEVDRLLNVFVRKGDARVAEYPITIELDTLAKIVKPMKNDELLYRTYTLSQSQVQNYLLK